MIIGFVIWELCGVMFLGFGIAAFCSQNAVGFWANVKVPEIEDVKAYNKAVGKLWCVVAVIFMLLGFPLLMAQQNSPLILLSVVGVMLEMIGTMVVYSIRIEGRYRKKG